jgi:hypothetical protein
MSTVEPSARIAPDRLVDRGVNPVRSSAEGVRRPHRGGERAVEVDVDALVVGVGVGDVCGQRLLASGCARRTSRAKVVSNAGTDLLKEEGAVLP